MAGASYVVTGDDDLLALDPFRGVRVIPALAFLNWTAASS
jgi:predicted nucleic acid-binding protein